MNRNMNSRKGFTLIELLIVVVIVGILALAAIPLITENTRDARRAETESAAGSIKTQLRAVFAKSGAPTAAVALPIVQAGAVGEFTNGGTVTGAPTEASTVFTLQCDASGAGTGDGTLTSTFNLKTGASASNTWA